MRKFNIFLALLTGIVTCVFVILGVHYANIKKYDESTFYLLLCIINYMTFLDCTRDIDKKE